MIKTMFLISQPKHVGAQKNFSRPATHSRVYYFVVIQLLNDMTADKRVYFFFKTCCDMLVWFMCAPLNNICVNASLLCVNTPV